MYAEAYLSSDDAALGNVRAHLVLEEGVLPRELEREVEILRVYALYLCRNVHLAVGDLCSTEGRHAFDHFLFS